MLVTFSYNFTEYLNHQFNLLFPDQAYIICPRGTCPTQELKVHLSRQKNGVNIMVFIDSNDERKKNKF